MSWTGRSSAAKGHPCPRHRLVALWMLAGQALALGARQIPAVGYQAPPALVDLITRGSQEMPIVAGHSRHHNETTVSLRDLPNPGTDRSPVELTGGMTNDAIDSTRAARGAGSRAM